MQDLLFVDTNIYLDFYRIRNEFKSSFLEHLEAIRDSLITTDQVEMEFKKNRQNAILEGMAELKVPPKISIPTIVETHKSARALVGDYKKIKGRISNLKDRIDKVLNNPSRNDKAFQTFQRIFKKKQAIDLFRGHDSRYAIRELAEKRFMLGYPPRKNGDTSIGDAINWEWLIHVAQARKGNIWLVTRDRDFGVTQDDKGYLNDWLQQEFRERVNKQQKIVLCPKLSIALRHFQIPVSPEEEGEENRVIELDGTAQTVISDRVDAVVVRACRQCRSRFDAIADELLCPLCR